MARPVVFVSYSREDEKEKDLLLSHLSVLQRQGLIDLWSDDRLGAGTDWQVEIGQAITQASVAILLITANYLNSDFVLNDQIPVLLQRQEREGLVIFPIVAKACAWRTVNWLTTMEVRPKNGEPVWRGTDSYVDDKLASIAEEVATIVENEQSKTRATPKPIKSDSAAKGPQTVNDLAFQDKGDRKHVPRIFLCHASEDKPQVIKLYDKLKEAGYHPWLDKEDLLPGQDWWTEIKKIISNPYNIIMVCLSEKSTTKRGIVQKEIKRALGVLDQMPENIIYLIPVRLEAGRIPDRLSRLQWVDLFEPKGFELLKRSLDFELRRRRAVPPAVSRQLDEAELELLRKPRRIDAAAPRYAQAGKSIDLLVQVRFSNSPYLSIKDWPTKEKPSSIEQTSDQITLEYPIDSQTGRLGSARLEIQAVTNDFKIAGEIRPGFSRRFVDVPPDQYSKLISFVLTANRAGNCRVNVEIFSVEHLHLGTIPIEPIIGGETIPQMISISHLIINVVVARHSDIGSIGSIESRNVNISDISDAEIDIGNIVSGSVEGDIVGKDKIAGDKISRDKISGNNITDLSQAPRYYGYQSFAPELILIPASEFLMGSDPNIDKDAEDEELPQHRLFLPDYCITKSPVTNAQYFAFVQAMGHRWPIHWQNEKPSPEKENHPVVSVSWQDAVDYCFWLTETTRKLYRLPTEAEWEKAARGTDGRVYPWGNQWDQGRCNTKESNLGITTPVGAYPHGTSPFGVQDIAGNVSEWCTANRSKPYPYDCTEDEWSTDYLAGTGERVLRGGSWRSGKNTTRCAYRNSALSAPAGWANNRGFRVVCVSS